MSIQFHAERLAETLRAYRTQNGISLRNLEAKTGISSSTLSRMENQKVKNEQEVNSVLTIINYCNLPFDQIFVAEDGSDNAALHDISAQLRSNGVISDEMKQALAAVIRAVRQQTASDQE